MKLMKRLMIVLLALILVMPMTAHAAGKSSPSKTNINNSRFTISVESVVYNGKNQKAEVTVKKGKTTLKEGKHYLVKGTRSRKNPGEYTLKIKGIGKYSGTKKVTFEVKKASPKLSTGKVKTYKASALKKKKAVLNLNVKHKGKGKITYSEDYKKITVSKNGKVTLKKGLKKGNYKIKIKIKATKYYKASTKVVTIKVK